MQKPRGNTHTSHKKADAKSWPKGRVVDMRAWKIHKRQLERRAGTPRLTRLLRLLAEVLAVLGGIAALFSCIPGGWQAPAIVWSWFIATLATAIGLWLYVLRDRIAAKLLAIYVVYMAVSFVAAVVKVYLASR